MTRSIRYSRIFVSIALVFCMLFGMMSIVDADSYSFTVYPLGSNSRTTRHLGPDRYSFRIYISDGKSGSAVKKDSLPGWITVNSSNADYYIGTITANTAASDRTGSIIFTKGSNKYELRIIQTPFKVLSTNNENSPNVDSTSFGPTGGSKNLYLIYNYPHTVSGAIPHWLTVNSSGRIYSLKAQPNFTGSPRSCTLYFNVTLINGEKVTRDVTIVQRANSITGFSSTITLPNTASYQKVSFKTGYGTAKVTTSPAAPWFYIEQSGNAFTLYCYKNNTNASRTGYIYIKLGDITKKITVTQAKG